MLGPVKLRYSIYEAKAKLSQILRLVRQGKHVTITDRGREVARVVPLARDDQLEQRISDLEAAGVLGPRATRRPGDAAVGAARPGALRRFLQDRD